MWQPSQDRGRSASAAARCTSSRSARNKAFLQGRRRRQDRRRLADSAARSSISRARCSSSPTTCSSTATSTASRRTIPEIALQRDGTIDASKYWFNMEGLRDGRRRCSRRRIQKRAFPFRIDNLRGPGYFLVNANVVRNFGIGGSRSLQFRLDVQNLLDSVLWSNPEHESDEHQLRQGDGRDQQHHAVLHVRLEGELLDRSRRGRGSRRSRGYLSTHGQGWHHVPGRFYVYGRVLTPSSSRIPRQ